MSNAIAVETIGRTRIITFSRPEIRSPLSVAVVRELLDVVSSASTPAGADALIFTGTGTTFASGADLREIAGVKPSEAADFAKLGQSLMSAIESIEKPTFASVNGHCFGGALDLALACDYRIASPSATFAHPGAGLGIITGWGGTQRLPRRIGLANALEMFFTATPIGAERAAAIGLVDQIAADPLAACLANIRPVASS